MADQNVTDMANQLAEECLSVQHETGNERLFMEVATVLGASSQTMEEAFLTAIRTRMAALQGRTFMQKALAAHKARTPQT
ncbi:hypothetical protein [Sulfitobacter sp. CW3]|jgi:hypothetical protein|uniref:hypothetical protein n=1 Tax=unclassified Sulfitobacter TaxID=196795 RepID=UPI001A0E6B06|nr:hypothetical protein [Sulfitobacter sp. CW3]MBW4962924.1 hypothetical protein [Sulfitobacter sp. CW3]NOR32823.1 hypothetical protein [Sulfitobacter sp.]|tara:strand:+ start:9587 stop:9826 length:240 start_codon:yes stop_codon:yes gene_type:complete